MDSRIKNLGCCFTTTETTPHSTNSQMISEAVETVVIATAAKSSHSNQSLPMVLRDKRYALWPIMAMTAALLRHNEGRSLGMDSRDGQNQRRKSGQAPVPGH